MASSYDGRGGRLRPSDPNVKVRPPTRQGLLGSLGGSGAGQQGWGLGGASLHHSQNCPWLTWLSSVDFPVSPGPTEVGLVASRQKLGDITWPVYGPGSSEITSGYTLTIWPLRSLKVVAGLSSTDHHPSPPSAGGAGQAEMGQVRGQGQAPGRALEAIIVLGVCV